MRIGKISGSLVITEPDGTIWNVEIPETAYDDDRSVLGFEYKYPDEDRLSPMLHMIPTSSHLRADLTLVYPLNEVVYTATRRSP